jgi:hypothetical protein
VSTSFQTDRWALDLPEGMQGRVVKAPPECTSMAHIRGEFAPSAPAIVIVSSRVLGDSTVPRLARKLAKSFLKPVAEPQPVAVLGTKQAVRVDGLIEMEEGLSEDGVERIAIVVAKRRGEAVVLTIRTRPDDDVTDAIGELLRSFAVR